MGSRAGTWLLGFPPHDLHARSTTKYESGLFQSVYYTIADSALRFELGSCITFRNESCFSEGVRQDLKTDHGTTIFEKEDCRDYRCNRESKDSSIICALISSGDKGSKNDHSAKQTLDTTRSQSLPRSNAAVPLLLVLLGSMRFVSAFASTGANLRHSIMDGEQPCFYYDPANASFHLTCHAVSWKEHGYTKEHYILLRSNETFDGGNKSFLDLRGISGFHGLFRIDPHTVFSFDEAPEIRNVHIKNGELAEKAGFIVQQGQGYFRVDSCSSTGAVSALRSGGICGAYCGGDNGQVKITNCHSSGKITGRHSGGVAGYKLGYNHGLANLTRCHSDAVIGDSSPAGGICGNNLAQNGGAVYVKQSFSTGTIFRGGGILTGNAGFFRGFVRIEECYTRGDIMGSKNGGIAGSDTGENEGEVEIVNCYATGRIVGEYSGGITGWKTGGDEDQANGKLSIKNVYSSGTISADDAGGIIGDIADHFGGSIDIKSAVYNGENFKNIVGDGYQGLSSEGISGNLEDIRGRLYQSWSEEVWALNGSHSLPILRFQLGDTTASPPRARYGRLHERNMLSAQRGRRRVQ
eukprot:gb/GECG01007257.1/.p1 GENE.gb/GECG01007257.1/~~gb/GECG01007257.1/.p1  ORF type:complete len:579 (+),score=56.90 gb/GECG01007257.1/:1-1737(+)